MVKEAALALKDTGMFDLGYNYVNLDDVRFVSYSALFPPT
jgi:hypothetical protein